VASVNNLLLAALPSADLQRVMQSLVVMPLRMKELLHTPDEHLPYVYFPAGGFLSILNVMEDGGMVEVATIGKEGAAGVFEAMDGSASPSAIMVQAETDICYRMTREAFRLEMDRRGEFYCLLSDYAHALIGLIMQSTACNALHSVEQRLARWLLLAHDRVGRDQFSLTQEVAAMMLGASRPTVTLVAGTLQKAGLITYRRGMITIQDREQLEAASCECYRAWTRLHGQMMERSRTRRQ
jgi:CRP-like cAMP-binding protein